MNRNMYNDGVEMGKKFTKKRTWHRIVACMLALALVSNGNYPIFQVFASEKVENESTIGDETDTTGVEETESTTATDDESATEVETETETESVIQTEAETESVNEAAEVSESASVGVSDNALSVGEPGDVHPMEAITDCAEIGTVTEVADIPVTLKMFNYTKEVNYDNKENGGLANADVTFDPATGAGSNDPTIRFLNSAGFRFWQGQNQYAGYADDGLWGMYGSVDGQGAQNGYGGPDDATRQKLVATHTYGNVNENLVNGFPYLNGYTTDFAPEENSTRYDFAGGSLGYLFDENHTVPAMKFDGKNNKQDLDLAAEPVKYYKGTMTDGGGLFRQNDKGYYYYDSAQNAAYYDSVANKFTLYNHVVLPKNEGNIQSRTTNDVRSGNFFPFNELKLVQDITDENNILDATDGSVKHTDTAEQTYAQQEQQEEPQKGTHCLTLVDAVDYWFGMSMEYEFYMPKDGKINEEDMIFRFAGDDDVYVFVDNVLFLDLGGIHGAVEGEINFSKGTCTENYNTDNSDAQKENEKYLLPDGVKDQPDATVGEGVKTFKERFEAADVETTDILNANNIFDDYTKHTLKFFYMERGGNLSHCSIMFNLPPAPESPLSVTKTLDKPDTMTAPLQDYMFRVVVPGATAEEDTVYVKEGTDYSIVTLDENGNVETTLEQKKVGANGIFTIKAGETAYFPDILDADKNQNVEYVVQELIPVEYAQQYDVPTLQGATLDNTIGRIKIGEQEYFVYETTSLSAGSSQSVTYNNKITPCNLTIIKKEAKDGSFADNATFKMSVKLNGDPIKEGTSYTLYDPSDSENGVVKSVQEAGIIPLEINQKIVIGDLLAGSTYEVEEVDGKKYKAVYSGEKSGTLESGEVVEVVVTNSKTDTPKPTPDPKPTPNPDPDPEPPTISQPPSTPNPPAPKTTSAATLPQTGVLWWPIPVMMFAAVMMIMYGVLLFKREQNDKKIERKRMN